MNISLFLKYQDAWFITSRRYITNWKYSSTYMFWTYDESTISMTRVAEVTIWQINQFTRIRVSSIPAHSILFKE